MQHRQENYVKLFWADIYDLPIRGCDSNHQHLDNYLDEFIMTFDQWWAEAKDMNLSTEQLCKFAWQWGMLQEREACLKETEKWVDYEYDGSTK